MSLLDPPALGVAGTDGQDHEAVSESTDEADRENQEHVMKTVRNVSAGATLTAALASGGTYLAMAAPDGAATSTTQSPCQHKGGHYANGGITERLLVGDTAARVEAAATAARPGATVVREEINAEGAAYEVHIRKANGTSATVKMDASFNITGTETGNW